VSARCRSCGQEIEWAKTDRGRWMPIDPTPVSGGNLTIDRSSWPPVATVITPGEGSRQLSFDSNNGEILAYVSHFKSCPDSTEWRKHG
jgi:hypothetical protein